jgi:hypothetical protein
MWFGAAGATRAISPSLAPVAGYFDRNGNGEISMSTQESVQVVKAFFAAMGSGDKQGLMALVANGKLTNIRDVYRHASTGAGLRDGHEAQALNRHQG